MTAKRSLLIVGGGRMGEALLGGLLAAGRAAAELAVVEVSPARREQLTAAYPDVEIVEAAIPTEGAVLAVKPGDVAQAARAVADVGTRRILSVAAGVTTHAIEEAAGRPFPSSARCRTRPRSSAPAPPRSAPARLRARTTWRGPRRSSAAVGVVVRVPEKALDAVTGLSGSGPAYVFVVAEAMAEAGVLAGLPRDVAETLAFQTLLGAARLLVESGDGPAALRAAVTSPGGTTAAGLRELERHGVRAAFLEAVMAAAERSRELGA